MQGSPFAVGNRPFMAAAGDLDLDSLADVAVSSEVSDDVTVLLGQAGGGYAEEAGSPIAVGMRPPWVLAADFNGDGHPDLAVVNQISSTVTILLRQPGGGFAEEAGSPVESPGGPFQAAVSTSCRRRTATSGSA